MKLLNERQIAGSVRKFEGGRRRYAVAFWGSGGADLLGVRGTSAGRTMVICNLESGACNPHEVEVLKKRGAKVKTNPRLHAKVYTDGHTAIVGSSNASSNGMAIARVETKGLIELNVLSADTAMVQGIVDWFEALWNAPQTAAVSQAKLNDAKKRWALRPRPPTPMSGPGPRRGGLLDRCRQAPQLFGNVYAAFYDAALSDEATAKVRQLNSGAGEAPGLSTTEFGDIGAYESWGADFPDGAWLVDVDLRPKLTQPRITTQRIHDPAVRLPALDLVLAVRNRIVLPGEEMPLRITSIDREHLIAFGRRALNSKRDGVLVPLVDVAAHGR